MKVEYGIGKDGVFSPSKFLWRVKTMAHKIPQEEIDKAEKKLQPIDSTREIMVGVLTDPWLKQFFTLIGQESESRFNASMIAETAMDDSQMAKGYQKLQDQHMHNMNRMELIFNQFLLIQVNRIYQGEKMEIRQGWKIVQRKPK